MIVGIGLPKTGTTSLKKALEILGVDHQVGDHVHRMDTYPKGKYILTVRKDTETWYDSVIRWNRKHGGFKGNDAIRSQRVNLFGSEQPMTYWKYKYEMHNQSLSKMPNVLTVCFEHGDGWDRICKFIGCEAPNVKFPHLNKNDS